MSAMPAAVPHPGAVELRRWAVDDYPGLRRLRRALRDAVAGLGVQVSSRYGAGDDPGAGRAEMPPIAGSAAGPAGGSPVVADPAGGFPVVAGPGSGSDGVSPVVAGPGGVSPVTTGSGGVSPVATGSGGVSPAATESGGVSPAAEGSAGRPAGMALGPRGSGSGSGSGSDDDDVAERIAVVATELATNALRHGRGPAEVRLLRAEHLLVIEACDHDPDGAPQFDVERPLGQGGLGLLLARAFAAEVGWYRTGSAKHVWASFPV